MSILLLYLIFHYYSRHIKYSHCTKYYNRIIKGLRKIFVHDRKFNTSCGAADYYYVIQLVIVRLIRAHGIGGCLKWGIHGTLNKWVSGFALLYETRYTWINQKICWEMIWWLFFFIFILYDTLALWFWWNLLELDKSMELNPLWLNLDWQIFLAE